MKYEREIVKPIAEGVRLRFRYERGLEPRYSVTLEVRQGEEWVTVARPSIQIAMAHAIADAAEGWEAILQAWER